MGVEDGVWGVGFFFFFFFFEGAGEEESERDWLRRRKETLLSARHRWDEARGRG